MLWMFFHFSALYLFSFSFWFRIVVLNPFLIWFFVLSLIVFSFHHLVLINFWKIFDFSLIRRLIVSISRVARNQLYFPPLHVLGPQVFKWLPLKLFPFLQVNSLFEQVLLWELLNFIYVRGLGHICCLCGGDSAWLAALNRLWMLWGAFRAALLRH